MLFFQRICTQDETAQIFSLGKCLRDAFSALSAPPTGDDYKRLRHDLFGTSLDDAVPSLFAERTAFEGALIKKIYGIIQTRPDDVPSDVFRTAQVKAKDYLFSCLPAEKGKAGLFVVTRDIPEAALSLDLLTPLYQSHFSRGLSFLEGKMLADAVLDNMRHKKRLGSALTFARSALDPRDHQVGPAALVRKGILTRLSRGEYRVANPALELWLMLRCNIRKNRTPIAPAAGALVDPIYYDAHTMDPKAFEAALSDKIGCPLFSYPKAPVPHMPC